ncbi:MAG: TIGR03618 family F420-dependent PPOX class oxidoreductase [Chloroflexi bacterium]|nr:MAG: TIGR03618 family F420-dependent PPOX class oxidoreductase [Chloroflexota bacterium]
MTALAPDVQEFLRAPNVAAFASVRPDGQPHVTPVWYEYDGREFIVGSFRGAQKLDNIAHKGYAALCIFTQALPYQAVYVQGTARVGSPLDNVWRERVAMRYLGEAAGRAYARDTADWDSVAIHVRPLKWRTEGFETS